MKSIRIGFIGAGDWGQSKHLPSIKYVKEHYAKKFSVKIEAICEQNKEISDKISNQYDIPKTYYNLEDFSEDNNINCYVVVVSPKNLGLVIKALSKRKVPIFTEKPPGISYKEALYLAKTIKVPNIVGFNRRYFPIVESFKKLLYEMNGIYYVDCSFYRNERYDSKLYHEDVNNRKTLPFVIGTGVHAINLLEYLFGKITSCKTSSIKVKTNQTSAWLCDLTFNNKLTGRLKILPCSGSSIEWIEVHSQTRSLLMQFCMYGQIDYPGRIFIYESGEIKEVVRGKEESQEPNLVKEGFIDEYIEFFEAVTRGLQTRSNFENSVNTMKIAEKVENAVNTSEV